MHMPATSEMLHSQHLETNHSPAAAHPEQLEQLPHLAVVTWVEVVGGVS